MKGFATNSLGYTGTVTLSQYNGNKKTQIAQFKNNGGNSLFNFLANCLMGDFETAAQERPTKIMLLHKETEETSNSVTYESRSGFIYFLTNPERLFTDTALLSSTICYSFIIPMELIKNQDFNCIGLYSNAAKGTTDLEDFVAVCNLDGIAGMQSTSSILIVDWKLTITNNS